jgi:tryptophan 2,3-dioxygenase
MSDKPTTYASYIRVPELLSLQVPLGSPPEHDEMLFMVVHQVHELWFKQVLHELDAVRAALIEGKPLPALKGMKRIHTIQRVLHQQIDVLETMTPVDFNAFRSLFGSASGFQSVQFRCIEIASGGADPRVLRPLAAMPGVEELERRLAEPTLYEALLTHLWRQGRSIPEALLASGATRVHDRELDDGVMRAMKDVYHGASRGGGHYESYMLLEHFVEYEEQWIGWRHRHIQMVERTIGAKRGSGGSSGLAYLRSTLAPRMFPELWAVRSELGT